MPPATRSRAKSARQKKTSSKRVRIVNGRIRLRVSGFPGIQSLSPAHLVKYIPVSKLRLAAKKVLKLTEQAAKKKARRTRKGRGRKATKRSKRQKIRRKKRTQKKRAF